MRTIIKKISIITILTMALLMAVSLASAQACTSGTQACNQPITKTGFGAAQICGECFQCGLADGICPESYTDGANETGFNKTHVLFKIPVGARPGPLQGNAASHSFNTGTEACTTVGDGACATVDRYPFTTTNFQDIYSGSPPSTVGCGVDQSTISDSYLVAECTGVKRTAGCQWCVDPDCVSNVEGVTWSASDNSSLQANVNIVSTHNYRIESRVQSDPVTGAYSMQSPTGNVRFICTKEDYIPVQKEIFVHDKMTNTVDCALTEAYCTPECTMPNAEGVQVCRPTCEGKNGCEYTPPNECRGPTTGTNYTQEDVCAGLENGARLSLEWANPEQTEIFYMDCCSGSCGIASASTLDVRANDNIRNLVTKSYSKKLNGEPVDLKIIVYEKNI